jgi:DNA (cytosine-5)-methyltransferase 1
MSQTMDVVLLFSGCGGMDLGFIGDFEFLGKFYSRTHFRIIWANEVNRSACQTYRNNISRDIIVGDIWDHINRLPTSADVVIGGFPCQDISINGKGAGIAGSRSGLYRTRLGLIRKGGVGGERECGDASIRCMWVGSAMLNADAAR